MRKVVRRAFSELIGSIGQFDRLIDRCIDMGCALLLIFSHFPHLAVPNKLKGVIVKTVPTFQVVVVGGGLAGAAASKFLTEQGLSVITLEKSLSFGDHITCGEAVQDWVLKELGFHDPAPVVDSRIEKVTLKLGERSKTFYVPGISIVDKRALIRQLVTESVRNGGKAVSNARFTGLRFMDDGKIEVEWLHRGKEMKVTADFVIAADGATSNVCQAAGCGRPEEIIHGVNSLMLHGSFREGEMIFFVGPEFGKGYGWAFSKGDSIANVGVCGGNVDAVTGNFDHVVAENYAEASILSYGMKPIPVGMRKKVAQNGVFAVGDAGSFVEPLSYAGMWGAVMSARIASKHIVRFYHGDHKSKKEAVRGFLKDVKKEFSLRFKLAALAVSAFQGMNEQDWQDFFDSLDANFPDGRVGDVDPFRLAGIFLKDRKLRHILRGKLSNAILAVIQRAIS